MKLRSWLPGPIISGVLFITWLMLNQSASMGQMLLGAVLALGIPLFTQRVRVDKARPRALGAAARLTAVVLLDVVRSNIDVARRVLGPEAAIQPRFFWLPLTIRDPHGIVLLAGIITTTPGTISADLSPDRTHLLVHALHCPDEATAHAMAADIKARYEAPLMEIFE